MSSYNEEKKILPFIKDPLNLSNFNQIYNTFAINSSLFNMFADKGSSELVYFKELYFEKGVLDFQHLHSYGILYTTFPGHRVLFPFQTKKEDTTSLVHF